VIYEKVSETMSTIWHRLFEEVKPSQVKDTLLGF